MARLHEATTAAEVEAALAAGEGVDQLIGDCTPLERAVCYNRVEVVRALIAAGASVNKSRYGDSALHHAVVYDRPEILGILIAAGADVNDRMPIAWTPLSSCFWFRRWDCALTLIRHGADVHSWMLFEVVSWIT